MKNSQLLFDMFNMTDSVLVSHFLSVYFTFVGSDLCNTVGQSTVSVYCGFQINTLMIEVFQERDVRWQQNAGKGDFVWGPIILRKGLRHFQSFTRNGITVSVHSIICLSEIDCSLVLNARFIRVWIVAVG